MITNSLSSMMNRNESVVIAGLVTAEGFMNWVCVICAEVGL